MSLSKLVSVSFLLLVVGGVVWPSVAPSQGGLRRKEAVPLGVPWGITLETDRPFYRVGDAADVMYTLSNQSSQDAFGWSPQRGGNGCEYSITIVDKLGQTVWRPGSVLGGMYSGPGCVFGALAVNLPRRSAVQGGRRVPLVYQNPGGIGVQGQPLPPGFYQVCIDVNFGGPAEAPFISLGFNFTACVPIRIDP